jgi:hypothetical protein
MALVLMSNPISPDPYDILRDVNRDGGKEYMSVLLRYFALTLFGWVEAIPVDTLSLFGPGFGPRFNAISRISFLNWILFILFATTVYGFIGAAIGKVIELIKSENKIRKHWANLKDWQKGSIIGAGLHLLGLILLVFSAYIIVPARFVKSEGDMGPFSSWVLLALLGLFELLPLGILKLSGVINLPDHFELKPPELRIILFFIYATIVYSILGILLATLKNVYIRLNTGRAGR